MSLGRQFRASLKYLKLQVYIEAFTRNLSLGGNPEVYYRTSGGSTNIMV